MDLHERSDEELISDVTKLVGSHHELTAKLVAHLAEIEERRLHLLAGFSSMFDSCTNGLRFGEGEAFRRILAARLCRRFPAAYDLLASGSVNLSTLALVREWLTDENQEGLLAAVSGKTKREVQAFIATRFPRPDRPERIRRSSIDLLSETRFAIEFSASAELLESVAERTTNSGRSRSSVVNESNRAGACAGKSGRASANPRRQQSPRSRPERRARRRRSPSANCFWRFETWVFKRNAEARRAVLAVMSKHDPREPPTPEQALREAVLVATAA